MAKNNALAELLRDIGSIFFASILVGPFITQQTNWILIFVGIVLSGFTWYFGIRLIKG